MATAIASALGAGYMRPGPGTWGTGAGCLVLAVMSFTNVQNPLFLVGITILTYIAAQWSISRLPDTWQHDDSRIVIDEVLGVWVALWWLPLSPTNIILAFFLFRFYDILKPFGIRKFDQLKSDWSVLVDDIVAGVYTNLTIRLIIIFLAWI